jgi:hypothetical protein
MPTPEDKARENVNRLLTQNRLGVRNRARRCIAKVHLEVDIEGCRSEQGEMEKYVSKMENRICNQKTMVLGCLIIQISECFVVTVIGSHLFENV